MDTGTPGKSLELPLSMVKPTDTSSTKSLTISQKTASIKNLAQKSVQAVSQPLKKLKKSISTTSSQVFTRSCSSTMTLPHGDEIDDDNDEESQVVDHSEPESTELSPEQELGMFMCRSFHFNANTY